MSELTPRFVPHLDDLLTPGEAARWLGLSEQRLMLKTRGRNAPIPAFRVNQKVVRFHPRTILAKLARDAGVPFDVIAASYGMIIPKQP